MYLWLLLGDHIDSMKPCLHVHLCQDLVVLPRNSNIDLNILNNKSSVFTTVRTEVAHIVKHQHKLPLRNDKAYLNTGSILTEIHLHKESDRGDIEIGSILPAPLTNVCLLVAQSGPPDVQAISMT